ncbi:hypothetical protein K2173_000627 [Erythroxylum novogranatense]|uniref:HIT domain-containing protein n=1 Tax=Erythroxylum novogranatense TaxID=1862640 RepID=A0AAV8S808_9ROSI|nr:hypothetical protein K2173_000627 [Erythroxylum novogranatense]
METRRLAILCNHLRPAGPASVQTRLSSSVCVSGSNSELRGQNDCVFCKIIRGESPATKLYEDDTCLCILDTSPLSHGHSLIIPKSHFSSLETTPPCLVAAMCSKVPFIGRAIMKATGSDSFNLLVNNGASAGQVVFHTHIHIIPRKAHDCLWTTESLPRNRLSLDHEVCQLVKSVQEQLSKISLDGKGQESIVS